MSDGRNLPLADQLREVREAMKMMNVIRSPWDGTVANVHVSEGSRVVQGEPLVTFVPT